MVALLAALAACDTPSATGPAQEPVQEAKTGNASDVLTAYYRRIEAALTARGKLRTEFNPADAPITVDTLVKNFEQIALYDEYQISGSRFVERARGTTLRRWQNAPRIAVVHGASTGGELQAWDRSRVSAFTARLSNLTGLNMRLTDADDANLLVLFLNREEQGQFADQLPQKIPNVPAAVIDTFRNSDRNVLCFAVAFPGLRNHSVYEHALVLVKAEHSRAMRQTCIEEEMAQVMGLTNDSRAARPSIFNDDEEFARLTMHDEILLRMLYDERLKPGMSAAQVRPLLPQIAADALDNY